MDEGLPPGFLEALVSSIRSFCGEKLTFRDCIQFTGNLFMTVDHNKSFHFGINEDMFKITGTKHDAYKSKSCQLFTKEELLFNNFQEHAHLQKRESEIAVLDLHTATNGIHTSTNLISPNLRPSYSESSVKREPAIDSDTDEVAVSFQQEYHFNDNTLPGECLYLS